MDHSKKKRFKKSASAVENESDSVQCLAIKGNEGVKPFDPHSCYFCHKVVTCRGTLRQHLKTVHCRGKKLFCDLCPKFYFTKKVLIHHMTSHRQKTLQCNICDYKTPFKNRFKDHKFVHSKTTCTICSKQVASLSCHMRSHKPKESCPKCQKIISRNCLKKHIRRHHSSKLYPCDKCQETFEDKEKLRR